MEELTTAAMVIKKLGGLKAVAKLTGRGYTAISNWQSESFNRFPASTFLVLQRALEKKKCTAPDSLWNMDPVPDEEEQEAS